jgi:hypothetical protein
MKPAEEIATALNLFFLESLALFFFVNQARNHKVGHFLAWASFIFLSGQKFPVSFLWHAPMQVRPTPKSMVAR